jgi:hypothetical protein
VDSFFRWDWGAPLIAGLTILVEATLAVAPWVRTIQIRKIALALAIVFHAFIAVIVGLPTFSLTMIAANLLALNITEIRGADRTTREAGPNPRTSRNSGEAELEYLL